MGVVMLTLRQFIAAEDGATAIEYGLIAALVAVALITAAIAFGDSVLALFGFVRDTAGNAMDNAQL
jgi:pilus assembly protein Flp/PilA